MHMVTMLCGQDTLAGSDSRHFIRGEITKSDPTGTPAIKEAFAHVDNVGGSFGSAPIKPTALKDAEIWWALDVFMADLLNGGTDDNAGIEYYLLDDVGGVIAKFHTVDGGSYSQLRFYPIDGSSYYTAGHSTDHGARFDVSIRFDVATGVVHTSLYKNAVKLAEFTSAANPALGDMLAHNIFVIEDGHPDWNVGTSMYSSFVLADRSSVGTYIRAIGLENNGTNQDFTGDVTDINAVTTTPSATSVTATAADSVSTYTTEQAVTTGADNMKVISIMHANLANSSNADIPNLSNVIYDGTTVYEGTTHNVKDANGANPVVTEWQLNPVTGMPFTLTEVGALEFGFKAKA